jgi:hypothetical protein
MTQPPSASSGGAAPLSLAQRFFGMITSPKATFESVVSFPRWVGMLVLTTLLITVVVGGFMLSPVGREVMIDQMRTQNPSMPVEQAERMAPIIGYVTVVAIPIMSPIIALVIAGVLMGVFAITGGSASFKQVLATSVHAGVVSTVAGVINTIINYVRATTVNITSLAGLGQAFAEKGFVAGFLGALDLAVLWWLFVLALGMAVLYRRRTGTIFVSFLAVYLLIAVTVGAFKAAFGGS